MSKQYSREEIYNKLAEILTEEFEISEDLVKPEANLFEDLELDSIDAVDLAPENFKQIRTVDDVVDAIEELLK